MEKKRVRVNELLSFPAEYQKGLDELYIEKIDFYDTNGKVVLSLSGSNSLPKENSFLELIKYLEKYLNVPVVIKFVPNDVTVETYNQFLEAFGPYISYVLKKKLKNASFVDIINFYSEEGFIVLSPVNFMASILSKEEKEEFAYKLMAELEAMTGVTAFSYRFSESEDNTIVDSSYDNSIPVEPASYQYFVPEFSEAELKQIEKSNKQQQEAQKAAEKAPEGVNTDSWEYKAKMQQKAQGVENRQFKREKNSENTIIGRVKDGLKISTIETLEVGDGVVNVVGNITLTDDLKLAKSGKCIIANFNVFDKTGGISCVAFIKPNEGDVFEAKFKKGGFCGVQGEVQFNRNNEISIRVSGLFEASKPKGRKDNAELKRVELHVHSKMSEKDAVSEASDIMKLAAKFGHKACAITDHGVVQGFPDAYNTAKGLTVGDTEEKFKAILGCEGYLVDDGPTIFYGLPFNTAEHKAVGSFVTLSIKTLGSDHCKDKLISVAASKYRLKGYKPMPPVLEGESDEDAMSFSAVDIDTSLWEPEEIPEELRDENLQTDPLEPHAIMGRVFNKDLDITGEFSTGEEEVVPEDVLFEHVADFYAEFDDEIYSGKGEPCDSYFAMGELIEFIGDSYIGGTDIFNTLNFLRRAGYGINIEDHIYYRNKFLMPTISTEDIVRYAYNGEYNDKPIFELLTTDEPKIDEMLDKCYKDANVIVNYLIGEQSVCASELNTKVGHKSVEDIKNRKISPYFHIIYLARTNLGLYSMYRLISESHVNYFSSRPRTPKSLLKYYSSGMIIGGACESGEIYRYVMTQYKSNGKNKSATFEALCNSQEMKDILWLYDYIEIQPLCNNMFMVRQDPEKSRTGNVPLNEDDIRIVNELLVDIADYYHMPCCATTDSHFLEQEDGKYRKYLLMDLGFSDADMQSDLYFRTTDEMLQEFAYLGEEKAMEVVVTNTNMIADKIEYGLKPFPDGTYPPIISRAAADVRNISYTRANKMYRHNGVLDPVVKARLEKELKSIIGNGFAIMYYIAYRLVKKSNNDGYIVGSRGSVGSSFVATMMGISEVNPLTPHYRCPKCNFVEFDNTGKFGSGYDMPLKHCPHCDVPMKADGQDIPFETFLGFFGDKQPDIDLNFSGEYQPRAHKYVEFLFGTTHTFRAGTIGTYADKNAVLVARKACEAKEIPYTQAKLTYMSQGIVGVKRNTSQHPGGIVVVPKEMDVYEFTPIQYPANKTDCGIITTHFDFHAMHDTILKLDILGHADPTVLRMLQEITDVDITAIPIPEPKVMGLLESTDPLGFPIDKTEAGSATLGLSELGTHMARGMIKETKPTRFYDLVQLMGLSHGTDVWTGNAQDLIRNGICDLDHVIGCRDSIMTSLIYWGLPNKDSFDIMEKVRKGKGLSPEHEKLMIDNGVPDYYIESCRKIKYMFPKAHAAAYSISTLRVAWFKVYYPEEYYCAFFSIRGDEFDAELMCHGMEKVTARRRELAERMRVDDNPKIKSEFYLCEIVEEMYARGITFAPIDLYDSNAVRFKKIAPKVIRPPFASIDSISESMAEQIVEARESGGEFKNREEFINRTGIGQSATQKLLDYGGLIDDLPESAQVSLFDMFGIGE